MLCLPIVAAEININVSVLLELFGRMKGGTAGISVDLPLIQSFRSRSRSWPTLLSMVDQSLIIYRRITPYRSTMQSSNGMSLPCNASGPDRNHTRQGGYMMSVQYVCSDDVTVVGSPLLLIFSHFQQWIKYNIELA
ncbi:hypothetical protein AMTRI_Chr12g238960 [Amborella trichopoda]